MSCSQQSRLRENTPLLILLLAFFVRFAVLMIFKSWVDPNVLEYGYIAENIMAGNGAAYDFYGLREAEPFMSFFPPLYPFVVAFFLYAMPSPYFSLLIFQITVSSLTALNVYWIGSQLYDRKVGLLAGAGVALYPVFIISAASVYYPLTIDIFLLSVLIVMIIKTKAGSGSLHSFGTGLVLGITALSLPQVLAFYPFIIFWFFINKADKVLRKSMIIFVMIVLVMSPWIIRNYSVHGKLTISSNGGFNFWLGNNPFIKGIGWDVDEEKYRQYAGDRVIEDSVFEPMPDRRTDPKAFKSALKNKVLAYLPENVAGNINNLSEAEIDSLLFKEGIKNITEDFPAYVKRSIKKIYYLWVYRPPQGRKAIFGGTLSVLYAVHYVFLTPLVIAGTLLGFFRQNWRKPLLLQLLMVFFTLIFMNFFILSRYRWLFEPYMILIAAFFIFSMWEKYRNKVTAV